MGWERDGKIVGEIRSKGLRKSVWESRRKSATRAKSGEKRRGQRID